MQVERDDQGSFHVRGTFDDGEKGWGIKVWLRGSNQDGPADHCYRIINDNFHHRTADQSLSTGKVTVTDDGVDPNVDPDEKEAVLSLIAKWEERLPPDSTWPYVACVTRSAFDSANAISL